MPMNKTGLFWFTHDLRLHDQPALDALFNQVDELICVYCINPDWFRPGRFDARSMGEHRWQFLQQSLHALDSALAQHKQKLIVVQAHPIAAITRLIEQYHVTHVAVSRQFGFYEQQYCNGLQQAFPNVKFLQTDSHTLFDREQLPFELDNLPVTFTQFEKHVATLEVRPPIAEHEALPPQPEGVTENGLADFNSRDSEFTGGEQAGLQHLQDYFNSNHPSEYKQYRNELDGWYNSTKFSSWLANGSLSVRTVAARLMQYEDQIEQNESTSWILYELLWREYFQWYALAHQHKVFRFRGLRKRKTRCCFYPERYQKWCHGNTPYPLVNACMKQLNATGYMSNRGRQIVASCFVNELDMDWRYGAAYFEQQLIDHDVAINWGNWQYIAGVGADPRGGRHFNINKQTRLYDPSHDFIRRWKGDDCLKQLDSVDAADWPVMPPQ